MLSKPASARLLRVITLLLVLSTLLIPPGMAEALDEEPTPPRSSLTPEEREAFMQTWIDVFARGTVALNDTPASYDYDRNLTMGLLDELIPRLRAESPAIAHQFSPEVAGPMLGFTTPEDPLTGPDGQPLTQEMVDAFYKNFIGGLIFDRTNFMEQMQKILDPLDPEKAGVPEAPVGEGDIDAANPIRESLATEPLLAWANDLEAPVPPEGFVAQPPSPLATDVVLPEERDLSGIVNTSVFRAATATSWLDPDFHLDLPHLVARLQAITGLTGDPLLARLGLLADEADAVVDRVEGELAAFPEVAGPVATLRTTLDGVEDALLPIAVPRLVPLHAGGTDLPVLVEEVAAAAEALAASSQYTVVLNGRVVNATWGTPTLVDLDDDGFPDAQLTLDLGVSVAAPPGQDVDAAPRFTLERIDATELVPDLPTPRVSLHVDELDFELPPSALTTIDLALAYQVPGTDEVVVQLASVAEGASHLEVHLLPDGVRVATADAEGAFALTSIRDVDGDTAILALRGESAPALATLLGGADVQTGVARLDATSVSPGALTVAVVEMANGTRLALEATAVLAPGLVARASGARVEIDAPLGGAADVVLQRGAATAFDVRAVSLADAPRGTVRFDLDEAALEYAAPAAGASFTALVGLVEGDAFASASWMEVAQAGRVASLDLSSGGVDFSADRNVAVRAVRATGAGLRLGGALASGVLVAHDDVTAFALPSTRDATVVPDGGAYAVQVQNAAATPFVLDARHGADRQQYLLSSLPRRASFALGDEGLSIGTSDPVANVSGYLVRHLDGEALPPTHTALAMRDVRGQASVGMADATVNAFLSGSVGDMRVLSSNVLAGGVPVFAALPGDHTLADVDGALRQHSARLAGAAGNVTGGLFGPLGRVSVRMTGLDAGLCQSFGKETAQVTFCISNVPSVIDIGFQVLPEPRLTYDANAVIHEVSLQVLAPNENVRFALHEIPRHFELVLGASSMTLATDTRFGGIDLIAALGSTTLAAGLLDLPTSVTLTWGAGGVTPSLPAGDAIGRAYLFLSRPGLAFELDLVDLPPSVISWSAGAVSLGPVGDRIGSVRVQLAVSDLQFLLLASGVPGVGATWSTAGGTFTTSGTLDAARVQLAKGPVGAPAVSLLADLQGVPPVAASWSQGSMGFGLAGASKIASLTFQFTAGDVLIYLGATGIPSATFTMGTGGWSLSAPHTLGAITLVLAKGGAYYSPFAQATDFVGVYLRPEQGRFGASGRFTGIRSLSYTKSDASSTTTLSVGFAQDKTVRVLADLDSAALVAYLDATLTNLAATTTITLRPDGVSLAGSPVLPGRPAPYIQAHVGVGTPAAYAQTPDPRWPWQTTGLGTGVMANTMIDATGATPGVATKWRVYAPLPDALSVAKATSAGVPSSVTVGTGSVSLGKLDVRTNVKVNLNLCGGCAPTYLNTLVVSAVSNLPTSLTLAQGLGSGSNSGSPSFTVTSSQAISSVFLGVRFDGAWYNTADTTGGFPIWAKISDVPTSVSLAISKNGGWSAGNTPALAYSASTNTMDARAYLDVGLLWNSFAASTIVNAANAGRAVPSWLVGLAGMNARGHLLLELVDIPAAGISIYRSGQMLVVDPLGSAPLTKFFADFNLRFEKYQGDSGCIMCGVISIDWWWNFGYWFEINQLSLLLENLRYVSIDPGIESVINLDGHLVFHFRASVGVSIGAGVALRVNIGDFHFTLLCVCIPTINLSVMVDPGFISFQVNTYTWSAQYFYLGWPCRWAEPWWEPWPHAWCDIHYYVGFTYTIPDRWQWDAPIAVPPLVPFRGLNLYTGTHHVILNPRILSCVGNVCVEAGRLIPVEIVMAYAYVKYARVSGLQWWTVEHTHWF